MRSTAAGEFSLRLWIYAAEAEKGEPEALPCPPPRSLLPLRSSSCRVTAETGSGLRRAFRTALPPEARSSRLKTAPGGFPLSATGQEAGQAPMGQGGSFLSKGARLLPAALTRARRAPRSCPKSFLPQVDPFPVSSFAALNSPPFSPREVPPLSRSTLSLPLQQTEPIQLLAPKKPPAPDAVAGADPALPYRTEWILDGAAWCQADLADGVAAEE